MQASKPNPEVQPQKPADQEPPRERKRETAPRQADEPSLPFLPIG